MLILGAASFLTLAYTPGGIAGLGIIAALAWYLGRRRGSKDITSTPSSYVPYQPAPTNPPFPPSTGQPQYNQPQYNPASPQMAPIGYASPPFSQSSMLSSVPTQNTVPTSASLYNGQYGATQPLLAPPGSLGTVGSAGTATSSNSTKVNEVYVVAQPFFASQEDEMTCQQGQKVFVSDLFMDDWCKALNLETMQSGEIILEIVGPAASWIPDHLSTHNIRFQE
ncbi:hypothetical protein HDU93_001029 [Gonapodya sp. JEL0774]|nr:hypothetical protein HDU93_001029 [Gonapodya sp. JEL0774]